MADGGIDLNALPTVISGPGVEIRATEAGELTVSLVRLANDHDARPLFAGLPGDLCQCLHRGYVIRGTLRVWTAEGSGLTARARRSTGPPGHAPEALEDTEFLEISPTKELAVLYAHLGSR